MNTPNRDTFFNLALTKSFNHVKFNAGLASICGAASMYSPYWVSGFMTGAFAALAGFHFVMWYTLRKVYQFNKE